MPPSRRRARRLRVDLERFAGGWRRVPDLDGGVLPIFRVPLDRQPDVTVDVVRPDDLVALTFEAYGCALVVGGKDGPALVAQEGGDALLLARFPYQHLAELAIYEQPAPVPDRDAPSNPPVEEDGSGADEGATHRRPLDEVLPARASRLVFEVPPGHRIPFSSAGLLRAMGDLRMRTAALARPGAQPSEPTSLPGSRLRLPGGWILEARTEGLVLDRAAAAEVLDTSTVDGIIAGARDRRRARRLLEGDAVSMTARARRVVERAGAGSGADQDVNRVVGHVLRVPEIRRIPRLPGRAADQLSRPPGDLETAIEAPFRLVISPSTELGWRHATEPVAAPSAPDHVELWHTRLAQWVRAPAPEEGSVLDERVQDRRTVRALWARDRDLHPEWVDEGNEPAIGQHQPFRSSLEGADRHLLVRQTAETWIGEDGDPIHPVPVAARALWLSGLGAWLDLHGGWQTAGYSARGLPSIMAWDHVAPQGRDQYVRVVYPGFLYPFGHRAALVKVTERKLKTPADPVAGLYQRMFLVVGEPLRRYGEDTHRDLPFTQVRISPLITPVLDAPRYVEPFVFWPEIGTQRFGFVVDALDHEGRAVRLTMPMLWVGEHVDPDDARGAYNGDDQRDVEAEGQLVAFTPGRRGGESALTCRTFTFRAGPSSAGGADDRAPKPALERARAEIPAVERAAPVGAVQVTYDAGYVVKGFGGNANAGEVWARAAADHALRRGGGPERPQRGLRQPLDPRRCPLAAHRGRRRPGVGRVGHLRRGGLLWRRHAQAVRAGEAHRPRRRRRHRPGPGSEGHLPRARPRLGGPG